MTEPTIEAKKGPDKRFTIWGYRFALYTTGPARGKWECERHGAGVSGHLTPWGAWLALRRYERARVHNRYGAANG